VGKKQGRANSGKSCHDAETPDFDPSRRYEGRNVFHATHVLGRWPREPNRAWARRDPDVKLSYPTIGRRMRKGMEVQARQWLGRVQVKLESI